MRHFFSAKVRVVLILAVVLAIALTVIGSLTGLAIPDMLVQGVLTPLRTGVSRLRDGAEQYYSYMFRYEALEAENAYMNFWRTFRPMPVLPTPWPVKTSAFVTH